MIRVDNPDGYTAANMDEHYLVIIDNMVRSPLGPLCTTSSHCR